MEVDDVENKSVTSLSSECLVLVGDEMVEAMSLYSRLQDAQKHATVIIPIPGINLDEFSKRVIYEINRQLEGRIVRCLLVHVGVNDVILMEKDAKDEDVQAVASSAEALMGVLEAFLPEIPKIWSSTVFRPGEFGE